MTQTTTTQIVKADALLLGDVVKKGAHWFTVTAIRPHFQTEDYITWTGVESIEDEAMDFDEAPFMNMVIRTRNAARFEA